MKNLSAHELVTKIVNYLGLIWGVLFFPSLFMVILILTGHGTIASHSEATWKLMYYNILLFPILILFSTIASRILLRKKHYWAALIITSLPFLAILLELIAIDLVLWIA